MPPNKQLEVCIASVDDAVAAERGGATRLELNMALELGGLTPSVALFQEVREAVRLPIIVMIRPRAAGFCYSAAERRVMLRDAEWLLELGAAGIASGVLLPDATIDRGFWKELMDRAKGRDVVFHRAFDVVADQETALERLIELGTTRVLTSGGAATAPIGTAQLAKLVRQAKGRIEILPGSGVRSENLTELMRKTGCTQVHGSFQGFAHDPAGSVADATYPRTCESHVAVARKALDRVK